jgi:hypothetical protein
LSKCIQTEIINKSCPQGLTCRSYYDDTDTYLAKKKPLWQKQKPSTELTEALFICDSAFELLKKLTNG